MSRYKELPGGCKSPKSVPILSFKKVREDGYEERRLVVPMPYLILFLFVKIMCSRMADYIFKLNNIRVLFVW